MNERSFHSDYQRDQRPFHDEFGCDPSEVINAMDNAGDDIPHQLPEIQLEIASAGMTRTQVPVSIQDPFRPAQSRSLQVSIEASASVSGRKRGIHVSRFGDVIAATADRHYLSLEDCSQDVAERLRLSQGGPTRVRVDAILPFLELVPGRIPEKTKQSLETLEICAETILGIKDIIGKGFEVGFSHMTACPCVQQTNRHAQMLLQGFIESGDTQAQPLMTHSQRSHTLVELQNTSIALEIPEMLSVIDQTVTRIQNTLPREYELQMVKRAHEKPQFMEDVVRSLMEKVFRYCITKGASDEGYLKIKTTSMESIHQFDLEAVIAYRIAELKILLETS